jgi:cysteine synthase
MSSLTTSTAENVYAGPQALLDFLDPGKLPPTHLVELPEALNPFAARKVRVFVKLLFMTPLFNAKLFASRNLLEEAKRSGRLDGVDTLIENSSGNKILADAVLARLFGLKRVVATVPHDIPSDKQQVLELLGVECRKQLKGIEKAAELGNQPGWWNPAQYHNEANPAGSDRWLGPQLWQQTRGEVSVFCAGLGTGGTMIGTSRALKARAPGLVAIGVTPTTDDVPGVRSLQRLEEVGLDWRAAIDASEIVDVVPAYFWSLRLCGRGVLAGPSSGMALAGLYQHLARRGGDDDLRDLRNANGEVVAVLPCPDSALLYLDKYTTRLSAAQLVEALDSGVPSVTPLSP